MAERPLDERLRAALGPGSVGPGDGLGRAAARDRMLRALRRRRVRRAQGAAGAAVVVVALGVGLSQVLVASPPPTVGKSASAAGGTTRSAASATVPQPAGAACAVGSGVPSPCGKLATGSGATALAHRAAAAEAVFDAVASTAALQPPSTPLRLRVGDRVTLTLPELAGDGWRAPAFAGNPVWHGTGAPLVVRPLPRGAGRRFTVLAAHTGTFVLEASAVRRGGAAPSAVGPRAVWVLEVEVKAT